MIFFISRYDMNRFKTHRYVGNDGGYSNDTQNRECDFSFQGFGPPQASTLQSFDDLKYSEEIENAGETMQDGFQFQHPNPENENFGWEEINNASSGLDDDQQLEVERSAASITKELKDSEKLNEIKTDLMKKLSNFKQTESFLNLRSMVYKQVEQAINYSLQDMGLGTVQDILNADDITLENFNEKEFVSKRRHILGAVTRHVKNSSEIDNQCYNVMSDIIDENYKETVLKPVVEIKTAEKFALPKEPEVVEMKNEKLDIEELAKFAALETLQKSKSDEMEDHTSPVNSPPKTPPMEEISEEVTLDEQDSKIKKKKSKKEKKSKKKKKKREKKKIKKAKKSGPSLEDRLNILRTFGDNDNSNSSSSTENEKDTRSIVQKSSDEDLSKTVQNGSKRLDVKFGEAMEFNSDDDFVQQQNISEESSDQDFGPTTITLSSVKAINKNIKKKKEKDYYASRRRTRNRSSDSSDSDSSGRPTNIKVLRKRLKKSKKKKHRKRIKLEKDSNVRKKTNLTTIKSDLHNYSSSSEDTDHPKKTIIKLPTPSPTNSPMGDNTEDPFAILLASIPDSSKKVETKSHDNFSGIKRETISTDDENELTGAVKDAFEKIKTDNTELPLSDESDVTTKIENVSDEHELTGQHDLQKNKVEKQEVQTIENEKIENCESEQSTGLLPDPPDSWLLPYVMNPIGESSISSDYDIRRTPRSDYDDPFGMSYQERMEQVRLNQERLSQERERQSQDNSLLGTPESGQYFSPRISKQNTPRRMPVPQKSIETSQEISRTPSPPLERIKSKSWDSDRSTTEDGECSD